MIESRYPGYDVMVAVEEWDEHTQHVIKKRMMEPQTPQFFTDAEAATLEAALSRLLREDDPFLIGKVLEHIDGTLAHNRGDGYRHEGEPRDSVLWRNGLKALGAEFAAKTPPWQDEALRQLQQNFPSFFKTLLGAALTGYCSLPPVWSFMGYGGPAYPRGYVRVELGLTDPWEAKPDDK